MAKKKLKIEGRSINNKIYFITSQVLKIFDIKAGRFREWTDKKYITPDIKASSKGALHLFTKEGIYRICLFKKLFDLGFNRWIASKFSEEITLKEWTDISLSYKEKNPIGDTYLLIHGKVGTKKDKNWREDLNVEIIDWGDPPNLYYFEAAITFNLTRIARTIDALVK